MWGAGAPRMIRGLIFPQALFWVPGVEDVGELSIHYCPDPRRGESLRKGLQRSVETGRPFQRYERLVIARDRNDGKAPCNETARGPKELLAHEELHFGLRA